MEKQTEAELIHYIENDMPDKVDLDLFESLLIKHCPKLKLNMDGKILLHAPYDTIYHGREIYLRSIIEKYNDGTF